MSSLKIIENALDNCCNFENTCYASLNIVELLDIKEDLQKIYNLENIENQIKIANEAVEKGIISMSGGRYLRNPLISFNDNGEIILYNIYHADTRTFYLEFKVSEYNKTWRYMNEEDSHGKNKNNKSVHRIDVEKCYTKIDELLNKLTKYKRAFEILKDKYKFKLIKNEELDDEDLNKYKLLDRTTNITISLYKEEYELLEELMSCGTKDN